MTFQRLVRDIPKIGLEWHRDRLLDNTQANVPSIRKAIRSVPLAEGRCLIVSAGPSLYRQKSLSKLNGYKGTIIATDGAYIQCLRAGITPDYVLTLDPHPTRIVRWFGDPDLESNLNGDDYFQRQDLDISFRENTLQVNQQNIELIDSHPAKLVIACCSPPAVVKRTERMDRYWFVPLVDDPDREGLTQQMVHLANLPAMNTGGTVGNAAWVFAHTILKSRDIACVGMDFGYYLETPLAETQSWNMLKDRHDVEDCYQIEMGPWGKAYTDATYFWYRSNLIDMLEAGNGHITNCTEGGLLHGRRVKPMRLEKWLSQ